MYVWLVVALDRLISGCPTPGGAGGVYMYHCSPHTPFPLAPVRYYVMRSKSYHFSYHAVARSFARPPPSSVFSRFFPPAAGVCYCRESYYSNPGPRWRRRDGGSAWAIPLISRIIPVLLRERQDRVDCFWGASVICCHWLENKLAVSESEREREAVSPAGTIDLEMKTPLLEYLVWLVCPTPCCSPFLLPPHSSSGYFPSGWRFYWQKFGK